ncbi:hypothetical protein GR158_11660 [Shinella sp. AETb1-6]|uniref:DKNYY domain-containing protein n=1 Tax=Shinella sp. AETb1-6 TaxID=2692210 RepID=UPI001369DC1C|nr:DKNYY domain-containing protein [Shinella sp. AETb1-6]MXN51777.1 hypothetical protein [Shinella sp. AETb1-6]
MEDSTISNRPELSELFPLPYAHWYAASLFADVGRPAREILSRLGIDAARWQNCNNRYGQLHFANTGWVAGAYAREGLPEPEHDRALFDHLTEHDGIDLPVPEPFSMRRELGTLRRAVEANPRIGPFSDVDWVAHYICERRFPVIRYVHDGSHVCVDGAPIADRKGVPLAGLDPLTFRQLGDRWFCDAKRVYGQGETPTKIFWFVARGADPESFTVLNERYGADKAAGFYITNLRLPMAEPGTFEIVSYYYGRGQKPGIHVDESHYAKDSRKVYAYGVEIKGADAPSFHAIGDEGRYFADRNRIYWENRPIPEADRQSFTCASEAGQYCAYDKDRPFSRGEPKSVSAEFEHWSRYFESHPELTGTWWHREKARRERGAADAAELVPMGGPYFSDGSRVLVRPARPHDGAWVSLDHFDHDSLRHIVDVFAEDRHGLRYFEPGMERYGCSPVKGADAASFERVSGPWFRDRRQAYYFDSTAPMPALVIVKADLKSFEVLGGAYARDAKGLIVEGVRKRGIDDPDAVEALGCTFARMGETLLYRGKPVTRPGKVDPATARGVHEQLLIDAEGHMLFGGSYRKPLPGIDPATLTFLNRIFAADVRHVYALTDSGLVACPEVDRTRVHTLGHYAVHVGDVKFQVVSGRVRQFPLEEQV